MKKSYILAIALFATLSLILPTKLAYAQNAPVTANLRIDINLNQDVEFTKLQNGQIDIIDWPLTKAWIDTLKTDPNVQLRSYAEMGMQLLDINNQRWPTGNAGPTEYDPLTGTFKHYYGFNQPWDDEARAFRQAIAHLTNKDDFTAYMGGYATRMDSMVPDPALSGIIPTKWDVRSGPTPATFMPTYYFDGAYAQSILDAAGFIQGTTDNPLYGTSGAPTWTAQHMRVDPQLGGDLASIIFYSRADDPNRLYAGDKTSDNLKYAGIPVDYRPRPKSTCFQEVMVNYDYNIYTGGWSLGADYDFIYDLYNSIGFWAPDGYSTNYAGFSDRTFDTLSEGVKFGTTLAGVTQAAKDAQIRYAEIVGCVNMYATLGIKGYKTGWTGVVNGEGYGVDNYFSFLNMQKSDDTTIDYGFRANVEAPSVITSEWLWDWNLLGLQYDSLIGRNPYNLVEEYAYLATDTGTTGLWDNAGTDASWAKFTLRSDATFHDGTAVEPKDVAFSLAFVRDAGNGIAWNYLSVADVNHVGISGNEITIYFGSQSYWAKHWAGFLPIINMDLWQAAGTGYWDYTPASDWSAGTFAGDPLTIRDYHPWEHNRYLPGNGLVDQKEDGAGAWVFDTIDPLLSEYCNLIAFRGSGYYQSQAEVSSYLISAFNRLGNINHPNAQNKNVYNTGGYGTDQRIDGKDQTLEVRTFGSNSGWPSISALGDYNVWNVDADFDTNTLCNPVDLTIFGRGYGRETD